MPLVYARNRAVYGFAWSLQRFSRLMARSQDSVLPHASSLWHCGALPVCKAHEHPDMPGLWIVRNAVSVPAQQSIRDLVAHILHPPPSARTRSPHAQLKVAEREVSLLKNYFKSSCGRSLDQSLSAARAHRDMLRNQARHEAPPPPPLRNATAWEWFEFECGRWMAAMRPHSSGGVPREMQEYDSPC